MTIRTFPQTAGDGYLANQADYDLMARHWVLSGVARGKLNEFETFGDSTGMQVKVKSGHAFVDAHFVVSDAQTTLAIAAADPTNPRIDRVVLRLDRTSDPAVMSLAVVTGTAAGSPSAPALTRSDTGIWELSLAQIAVAAAASTIAAGNVTDERMYNLPPISTIAGGSPTSTSTSIVDISGMSVTRYFHAGDLHVSTSGIVTNDTNTNPVLWYAQLDGGSDVLIGGSSPRAAGSFDPMAGHCVFANISEGLHTVKLRWQVVTSGQADANTPRLTVMSVPKQ